MLDYRNLANVLLKNELVSSHEIDQLQELCTLYSGILYALNQ